MKKRFNFTSALTAILSSALIAMTTLPVLASNTNYDFDFSFDAGNTCVTSTEYKETRHAITMYCTWSIRFIICSSTTWKIFWNLGR